MSQGPTTQPSAGSAQQAGMDDASLYPDRKAYHLLHGRNPSLGNLLLADRALFYVHILHAMLKYRQNHELEPLYEDIYGVIHEDLSEYIEDGDYLAEHFRGDIDQLQHWSLISSRIEIERLRGYSDTRKRKFRFSLTEETVAFMTWLESRYRSDTERPDDDARDVLEDVSSGLNELIRGLTRCSGNQARDGDPRRVLYQLFKLEERTLAVNGHLGTFNARLLSFVIRHYEIGEAKRVLHDLEDFVEHFLRQIHHLRGSVVERMEKLLLPRNLDALRNCTICFGKDAPKTPHLLRQGHDLEQVEHIPFRLLEFYREGGKLDLLCHRVHDSSLKVWRKLHSHLRELERRSSRMDDLRARISEIAQFPEDAVPTHFFIELTCPATMRSDPNYWDGYEDAEPPHPRQYTHIERPSPRRYLGVKAKAEGPVTSLEQARLERLRGWMLETLGQPTTTEARHLSRGAYTSMDDVRRVMEFSKSALLDNGRKLRRLHYTTEPDTEEFGTVAVGETRLTFRELMIRKTVGAADGAAAEQQKQ